MHAISPLPSPQKPSFFASATPAGEEVPSAPATVLVVDDEMALRKTTAMMLECLGYKTLEAANGLEALQQLERNPQIGTVLLDILMPVMDGEETFRQIRSLPAKIPVILISGFELGDTAQRFSEPLPEGYLQKPFSLARLAGAVAGVLK